MWSKNEMEAALWMTKSTSEMRRCLSEGDKPSPGLHVSPGMAATLLLTSSGRCPSFQCLANSLELFRKLFSRSDPVLCTKYLQQLLLYMGGEMRGHADTP